MPFDPPELAAHPYQPPKAALDRPVERLSFGSFASSVVLGAVVAYVVRVLFTIAGEILRGKMELGDTPRAYIGASVVLIWLIGTSVGSAVGTNVAVRFRPGRWKLRALCVPTPVVAFAVLPIVRPRREDWLMVALAALGALAGGY